MRYSTTARLIAMAGLIFGLLIPITWVYSTVSERASRREQAFNDVSATWGGSQVVGGPVLSVPYYYTTIDGQSRKQETLAYAHVLPRDLNVEARLAPEQRRRGIFGVVVYRGDFTVSGRFVHDSFDWLRPVADRIDWSGAVLSVGVSDPRGLSRGATVTWNGRSEPFAAGVAAAGLFRTGIQARVAFPTAPSADSETTFTFTIAANGTRGVRFLPAAADTTVRIASSWPHPSFSGSPLPDQRQTSDAGFTATWRVPDLGRGYPSRWTGLAFNEELANRANASAFGVDLIQPVDIYLQTERAVKYAVLFLILTFMVFFLWEVSGSALLHPVQYAFVGFALCVFYLLLLSISEHAGFDVAYATASLATTLLIGGYARAVLGGLRQAASVVGSLAGLYGFLYLLLRLEDYALIAGSIGLFILLTLLMFITRRMNWYELHLGKQAPRPTA